MKRKATAALGGTNMNTTKQRKAAKATKAEASKSVVTEPVGTPLTADLLRLSESEYRAHMSRIETLMLKGSGRLSAPELTELRTLSLLAQGYEQQHHALEPPTTFAGILERKMYEMKLKQGELARRLQVSPAKLSLVISGKQKPDVALIKAAYNELQLDGNMLLRAL